MSARFLLSLMLLPVFALLPVAGLQAQTPPDVDGIDHVELIVTDLQRSLNFYRRLFGNEVWKHNSSERRYLPFGSVYLALEQGSNARVDHVCLGLDDFNITSLHRYLDEQQLPWQDYPSGEDLRVDDRDGTRLQLAAAHGWERLSAGSASLQQQQSASPLFNALTFDEVYITVSNLEVDSLHYARLLGQTGTLQAGSLWSTLGSARLRLSQAPVGQEPGVNYFTVLVSHTDLEAAADAVFAAGGIIETILPNGFSFWDPDGIRVLVRTAGQF